MGVKMGVKMSKIGFYTFYKTQEYFYKRILKPSNELFLPLWYIDTNDIIKWFKTHRNDKKQQIKITEVTR
jgi:hypothetical protein